MSTAAASPTGSTADKPAISQEESAAAGPSVAKAPTPSADDDDDDDGDDLFGAGDEEEDDEEDAIKRPSRQRRKVTSQSPAASPSDSPAALSRDMSTPPAADLEEIDEERNRLEHRESSADPGMGFREGDGQVVDELQEATFALPSLPVRRGAAHFFARLPNLLQYRAEPFDEDAFDEALEDEQLQSREGIRIDDAGLRSLLTTTNTIRWRWSGKRDADGVRVPESNARIVRWDDGSQSLQLGSEFYDITTTTERVQSQAQSGSNSQSQTEAATTKSLVPPQPVQHLTHLFVKHVGQDEVNVLQAEAPVMGSLTFRPTSITSESHQRLAKAVRQQRGTLVKETLKNVDPEMEKERQEREEKKRKQIRMREQRKRRKGREDEDDDAFWASAGRAIRRAGGAGTEVAAAPAATGRSGAAGAYNDDDDEIEGVLDDDDGFVVDDEDEEDDEEAGRAGRRNGRGDDSEMDVDEPDELDRLEAEAEKTNAREMASKAASSDDRKAVKPESSSGAAGDAAGDGVQAGRRRRIIESDEEE